MIGTAVSGVGRLLPRRSDYSALPTSWRRDVLAGVTVGVVALPLALAFGISSGVGAAAGLVTAVVAGLVAAVFGGSHVQVSGPTGAMAVVLAPIVAQHGLGSIALVTVLAGLIVIAAGVTGLGRAVTFLPWPVIEGFTLGIAAIIFLQQVPAAVGTAAPAGQRTLPAAYGVIAHVIDHADWFSAAKTVGVVAFVALVMIGLPRVHRGIPASLIAVVAATVLVAVFGSSVATIGELPSHLPTPVLPTVDFGALRTLVGAAWRSRHCRRSNPCCRPGWRRRCRRPVRTTPTANLSARDWPRSPRVRSAGCPPPGPSRAPRSTCARGPAPGCRRSSTRLCCSRWSTWRRARWR